MRNWRTKSREIASWEISCVFYVMYGRMKYYVHINTLVMYKDSPYLTVRYSWLEMFSYEVIRRKENMFFHQAPYFWLSGHYNVLDRLFIIFSFNKTAEVHEGWSTKPWMVYIYFFCMRATLLVVYVTITKWYLLKFKRPWRIFNTTRKCFHIKLCAVSYLCNTQSNVLIFKVRKQRDKIFPHGNTYFQKCCFIVWKKII